MNITLIGMSGVGKSRIGKLLSRKLNYGFIDIDKIIEKDHNKKLQEIIDCLGDDKFLELEESTIVNIGKTSDYVISPGGSSIYSDRAMNFLRSTSKIVFLNASLEEIKSHTVNFSERGIVGLKEKGLEELFEERLPLYRKYADVTIDLKGLSENVIVNLIIRKLM
jgi:shikimate kinase